MFSARLPIPFLTRVMMLAVTLGLAACSGVTDDLLPSGEDKRPDVEGGTIGTQVGQQSPDFALQDTQGNSRGLFAELATPKDGVVLYFTMWCPICDTHSSDMRENIIPNYPDVTFFLVDYVTGSITASRSAQLENGYSDMETLVDTVQEVFDLYSASMGTTVVVDSTGIVRMNEDYKDGVKLDETLQALP